MGSKIIIADDDELVRMAVYNILTMFGHEVVAVSSGYNVMDKISEDFDVVILDINMPGMDGFETMAELTRRNFDIPVIFLTGAGCMDYAVKAINLGAYDFVTKPIADIDLFNTKINKALEKRSFVRLEKLYKNNLECDVREKTKELAEKNILLGKYSEHLEKTTVQIMSSLQVAMEEKDDYTAGHTRRVTDLSMLLGGAIGLPEEKMTVLRRAAQFHDIGKLVIDLSCIQKPGKLNKEEWDLIKKHPEVGVSIIEPLSFMDEEKNIILHHHERLDGGGYPDGIGEGELCLLTRVITIADSFDAMTSHRNYRPNMNYTEAVVELRCCGGSQFDPELVEYFSEAVLSEDRFR
jgi:putative nucleotidyltransferase with HDIG domain